MFRPLAWIRTAMVAVARHDRELAELRQRVAALEEAYKPPPIRRHVVPVTLTKDYTESPPTVTLDRQWEI
jgi:hypothetical protein